MLYIIYTKYEITNIIINTLEKKNSKVQSIEIPLTKKYYYSQKIAYKLNQLLNTNYFTKFIYSNSIKHIIRKISPEDKILFWDFPYYYDIKYFLKKTKIPVSSTSLWIWNTINQQHLKTLHLIKNKGINIYTFDPQDSIKYNISLLNQVHYKDNLDNKSIIYDFLFIGMDKGRSYILNQLASLLKDKGYTYKFIIVNNENIKSNNLNLLEFITHPIPYREILNYISESKIIVDITQNNQTGITLRTLEAIFYNKKLLTNNQHIKAMDLYNSNNIMIMDKDNNYIDKIDEFTKTNIKRYKYNFYKNYLIEEWIKTFI